MNDSIPKPGFAANLLSLHAFGSWNKVRSGAESCMDVTLRLDSPGTSSLYSSDTEGTKRKRSDINGLEGPEHPLLALGLGRSPSSSDISKVSSTTACNMSSAKETDEESSADVALNLQLHLGNENMPSPKKSSVATPKVSGTGAVYDLQLSLSTGPSESIITGITPVSNQLRSSLDTSVVINQVPPVDEGSASSCWVLGSYMAPSLHTLEPSSSFPSKQKIHAQADPVAVVPDLTSTIIQTVNSPVACTSGATHPQQCYATTKACQFQGCGKRARGASGLCIAHGGGRRCQTPGCHKGAEGRTIFCKAHGGGRRCQYLGCTKSAEGRTDYCIAHGGGRRCSHEGCTRAARGKSGLCIRHGGGKRCQRENCTRSAEGYSGLCISHGGGKRCQFSGCSKGAQGSTMFCKAHGGGKRCTFLGCTKGAEGSTPFCKGHGGGKRCSFQGGGVCPKSVHGGTQFCVAHGGGKRCAVPGCTKSARGRTDSCVRHGGGKRCKLEGCGKSAQGSTEFCKAHGGGKRCSWGHVCDRFARGKIGLCAADTALVQDHCVHGGSTLGSSVTHCPTLVKTQKMKDITAEGDVFFQKGDAYSRMGKDGESFVGWSGSDMKNIMPHLIPCQSGSGSLPEGRVRGGSLMAMLAGGTGLRSNCTSQLVGGTSEQGVSHPRMHSVWSAWVIFVQSDSAAWDGGSHYFTFMNCTCLNFDVILRPSHAKNKGKVRGGKLLV
ncbi:uncharacterized protein LOC103708365 [Phoenix dactylifera]|uniref:Uncharacterized protein LOC103708365 n=1 Tax=Phoenix dactylifera TaxID=42345 RepID=A0A8B8J5N1_PHODC|nr:uncharacterized protein LOC103708365 [Phoenix dactylifera]XP_026660942.1 uncharacterized protein LOC103708365 [Phoenix dactylifera]XP_026660943.1 uncharacterized protein LOC103708365 [Phoenix dactylifera]